MSLLPACKKHSTAISPIAPRAASEAFDPTRNLSMTLICPPKLSVWKCSKYISFSALLVELEAQNPTG